MSRKQSLAKKIAHTLMAMSIVYSSGINIVVNQVYAAETKNLTNSDSTFSKVGTGGNNYYQPGGVTDGESVVFTGTVTENITNDIVVDIKGGKGGADDNYPAGKPTVDGGAKGGSAIAKITIDESLSDITLNNIKISVYGAEQGMSVYGTSNVGGAAEAYGLQVKHDLKITAADITVDAKSNSSIRQNIGDFKKPDTIAVGLQVEGSKVDFTGAGISLSAKANNNQSDNQTDYLPGNYDGGDVEAYGIRSSGSETTAKLTGTIKFSEVKGGNGDKRGYIDADSGIGAGRGGNVTAYGVEVNGGTAHLDLQNIETSNDNSLSGGSGGLGAGGSMSTVTTAVAGGSGGMVTAAGVHIAGGMADGNIGNITMIGSGGAGGTGGYGSSTSGVAGIGAAGGVGGDAVIAGIDAEAGQTNLTVAKVNIKAAGGIGGMGGHTSSGNISGMGGTGGTAYAHGVLGSGASNMQVKTADISVSGIGGAGGNGGEYNDVICGAGGTGGAAEAYGISAINSVVDIDAGNIQTTASGGKGGNGGSAKISGTSGKGGKGGNGGMLTAAGVRIAGGKADGNIGDITMIGSGGDGGAGGSDNYGGSTNRAGIGAAGGVGGDAVMAGIDAEAGQTDLTVTEVNIKTTGGIGGIGSLSDTATSGAGGTGGTAYAHGVRGSSASMMQIKTADISVSGIGGAGGTGGTSNTGTSGIGGTGGNTYAYGVLGSAASSMQVKAADIIVSGIGGAGGVGGSNYANSVLGGNGGAAEAYGIRAINSVVDIDAANIQTTATGGKGGTGGYGGQFNNKGDGGNAYAYGVQSSGGTVTAATDKITATASGGMAGDAGSGSNGGVDGTAGSIAAEAKAYGIYAEQNAVINLHAKSTGTIKIGAKAENATNTEAYAVYADKATVIFHDNAELNTSDGSIEDNNVLTYLKDATLGFGGTTADRIVTGGTLKLEGSNTFRFTTNLANNQADSMTFDTIENNSSKQYIQIGYEEAFKDALSEADIVTITGNANVLTINNLNGQNLNNFTGQASSLDSPLERFKVTPTVDVVDNKVNITEIALAKENSPSETAMAASDAQMAMGSMWRIEGNNLMKRMGELRSDKEAAQGGVWARYYRGELSADSAYDRNYSQDYTAFQGGIDKVQDYKGGKLYTGIAVNRIDSNAGYTAGSGDLSSTGVGLYASWLGSKGHYVDVIARGSKLANDFKLVDLSGNAAKADYDTWAYGISAEYGYRQNLNAGWFVEPQAELSLGRIGSVDYTTSNDVTIKQDSVNSAVVRLGFLGGKEFTIGGRTSNAYVKASALHDFGGDGGATGYYENTSLALQTGDLTGTWYEIGLGANLGIAKNSNLYFDALKTFGGNLRTDWQFNAGLRFSF